MKLAVVGYGYWGPNLVRNLLENALATKLILCDQDRGRLEAAKKRWPQIECTEDFHEVLNNDEIEAVFIATPISTHAPLGIQALRHGKHVFIEKPLSASVEEGEALVEEAERTGRTLMVGHTFLFSPSVIKTKEIIDSGELGDIQFLSSSRVNLGLHQKDVSVIWDLAPHDFSILFHLMDAFPESISAFGGSFIREDIADVAIINMRFPSGAIGSINVSWLAPSKIRTLTAVGSQKMLVYDDCEPSEKVKIFDKGVDFKEPESFGEFQLSYRTGDICAPRVSGTEPIRNEMQHFLSCCQSGQTPNSNGRFGLEVVRALSAAETSLKNGGAPVFLSHALALA